MAVVIAASISAVIILLSICVLMKRKDQTRSLCRVVSQSEVEGNASISMTNLVGNQSPRSPSTVQIVHQITNLNGEGHEQTDIVEHHENTSGDEDSDLYDKMDDTDPTAGLHEDFQNINITPKMSTTTGGL